jgi:hypothetical protein
MQFAMRDGSKRPSMAFLIFSRGAEARAPAHEG